MNKFDLVNLEFDKFKDFLANSFKSVFAKEYLRELKPYSSKKVIEKEQHFLREVYLYIDLGEVKLFDDVDYYNFYKKLMDPYQSFVPFDLIIFKDFHKNLNELKKEILKSGQITGLKEVLKGIFSFGDLIDEIGKKVADNGQVKSSATVKLQEVRDDLAQITKKIYKILNGIIYGKNSDSFVQERTVTERNGRFVIPCKPNFRQFLEGIVHDISKSGQTYFVEPSHMVDLNNRYQTLRIEEDEEVRKIIYELLQKVKSKRVELVSTVNSYKKLIFYIEFVKHFGNEELAFPEFSDEINFSRIHHPLIYFAKRHDSVAIDFSMSSKENLIVISGPNTGGKTAALKSVGLNHIIAMCGLPLFGKKAKVCLFDKIMADIGDKQSLVMDLSTFSAHLMNIKGIVDEANNDSLILLDELGTGTEPKEGAALAVAIIDYLMEKNAKLIVTTHFKEVKEYALHHENAENFAVDFDYKTFQPKYRLLRGVIGKSDPLLIAKRLKFKDEIVQRAVKYLTDDKANVEYELEKINEMRLETEILKKRLEVKEQELKGIEAELMKKQKELNEKLKKKEEELLEEAYYLLQKSRRYVRAKKIDEKKVGDDFKKVSNRLQEIKKSKKPVEDIKVGDKILLEKYNKVAEILDIKKNRVYVNLEGMRLEMKRGDLIGKKLDESNMKTDDKKLSIKGEVDLNARYELNIIGKLVEDALVEVDKFLDKCVLSGINTAVIIHGRGTGALRKGVHEFLRRDRRVKSFRTGTFHEGGDAVTIVEF